MFAPIALSAVALGASLSSAILIPANAVLDAAAEQHQALQIDTTRRLVGVECAGCPFAKTDGDDMVWTQGVDNTLLFDIETGPEQDHLEINGARLFPPTFGRVPQPIYVHQVPSDINPEDFAQAEPNHKGLRLTGYEFKFDAAETISDAGNELLPMQLTLFSIAGQSIPPKTLTIHMIKDVEGRLNIAHIGLEEARPIPGLQDCETMVCKLKAIIASKMHGFKGKKPGCHGKLPGHIQLHPDGHGKGEARPFHGHRHHGHHHKFGRVMHLFMRGFVRVIVPILVGVAAGVATYLGGMVLGMTVAFIYLKIRGRTGQYARVAEDEENVDEYPVDKKIVFVDEEEALPVYVEAEEKEVVVVEEKA